MPVTSFFVGFGDNIRVIDWALRRCDGDEKAAVRSPIGFVPAPGTLNIKGLENKVT
jgi:phosphoenolpyruvate carboxykinase (GTP)